MKQMKNSEFRIQNVIAVLFVFSFYILHSTFYIPASAQEASGEAKTATQSSTLLQKLGDLKKDIASKAAQLKTEITKKMGNKAILGQIKSLEVINQTAAKMSLQSLKGTAQNVLINEYTIIQTPNAKLREAKKGNLSLKDLATDQMVLALGDIDDKQVLNAKKVIKYDKFTPDDKVIFWGEVESVTDGIAMVKMKDGSFKKVVMTKATGFKVSNEDTEMSEVVPKRIIIVVGDPKTEELIQARTIFMSGGLNPEKKAALPSPSPKK
jgi:hypothetical protein